MKQNRAISKMALAALFAGGLSASAQNVTEPGLPGLPTDNGLLTNSPTVYINTPDVLNNGNTESLGIAIASNGNIIVGWEDDADDDTIPGYIGAAWTLYNSSGVALTPPTVQESIAFGGSVTNRFLSYFRANGSATPAFAAWGPKIKANPFGDGFGMGATTYQLAVEVPELAPIENNPAGENSGDYPSVQLLTSAGAPIRILTGLTDTYADTDGDVRIGDWDYLSNGNVLIVGESRQRDDLVSIYGGSAAATHVIYRIVSASGTEVKAISLASESAEGQAEMWHGSAVSRDGFALRLWQSGQAQVRLFSNDGTPITPNILLSELTGNPVMGGGGRGEDVGFSGNANSYLIVNKGADDLGANVVVATVLNTDGTLRYSKVISADVALASIGRVHAAIDETGRVIAVWDGEVSVDDGAGGTVNVRIVMGRLLDAGGNPLGGTFYVSEKEAPVATTLPASDPRVAFRNGLIAVTWESRNAGSDLGTVALRVLSVGEVSQPGLPGLPTDNGLLTNSPTVYINTADVLNNGNTESLGVAIASNGNIIVGWEDDAEDDTIPGYIGAAWTLYNSSGVPLTPPTVQESIAFGGSTTNRFLSYFRANGSAVPAFTSWGPKIKANPFGDGFGMGATSYQLAVEVPELAPIENNTAGENSGDYPAVQLLTDAGAPIRILTGLTDTYADTDGDVRIGDWDYLSNGNILIVGESRQRDDLVNIYGGSAAATHVIYRIVSTNGTEVKAISLASETAEGQAEMWHGSAVSRDGFALRLWQSGQAQVRLFSNDGSPITTNILLSELTGNPVMGGGGRGEDVGFSGNANSYLIVNKGADALGTNVVVATVLNTNGTLRYSKVISSDVALAGIGRVHAAIDETGRVVAVWDGVVQVDDGAGTLVDVRVVMGRLLDPNGDPVGGTFYVSEKEPPVAATLAASDPRVAFRNGVIAVTWESRNAGSDLGTVALRVLSVAGVSSDLSVSVARTATGLRLTWEGGSAPYTVQKKTTLNDATWTNVTTVSTTSADVTTDGLHGFFRVVSGTP